MPLFAFWREHATALRFCCLSPLTAHHINNFLNAFDVQAELDVWLEALKPTIAVSLRSEFNSCPLAYHDTFNSFCSLKAIIEILDAIRLATHSSQQWTQQERLDYKTAVLSHIALLVKKYPNELSFLNINVDYALINSARKILALVKERDIVHLELFVKLLPRKGTYKTRGIETCAELDHVCIFTNIAEEVNVYMDVVKEDMNPQSYDGKRRLVLNTDLNYEQVLEQSRLNQILATIDNNQLTLIELGNEIKTQISNSFTTFTQYFTNLQAFDQQITDADIGYITGRLDHYTTSVANTAGVFQQDMGDLLHKTVLAAGLEVFETTCYLAMEVASIYNPLQALTGGTSPVDIVKAIAEFKNAIATLDEAIDMREILEQVSNNVEALSDQFTVNAAHLANVKIIVDQSSHTDEDFERSKILFVNMYTDYSPAVTLPDIERMGSIINTLIQETCEMLAGFNTAASLHFKVQVNDAGYCRDLPVVATEMVTAFTEIYDFQFDLIDALADYVRASVGLHSANEIKQELSSLHADIDSYSSITYELMGGLIYMAYESYNMHIVHLECNRLEYLSGGRRPSVCNGMDTNIDLLIAQNDPICRDVREYFHVPTKPGDSDSSSNSFMDLNKLFSKETIQFKIPSSDWLVKNRWIDSSERDNAFYVKDFQVFLPLKPQNPKKIISTATTTVYNELIPGSTEYVLIPNPHIVFEYELGPPSIPCPDANFNRNPYTTCDTESVSKYCDKSLPLNHYLFPSIYSKWIISMTGWPDNDGEMVAPNPANNTKMSVIVGAQICKLLPMTTGAPQSALRFHGKRHHPSFTHMQQGSSHCCPAGQYRPDRFSYCKPCPVGSDSALAGYYCESNT